MGEVYAPRAKTSRTPNSNRIFSNRPERCTTAAEELQEESPGLLKAQKSDASHIRLKFGNSHALTPFRSVFAATCCNRGCAASRQHKVSQHMSAKVQWSKLRFVVQQNTNANFIVQRNRREQDDMILYLVKKEEARHLQPGRPEPTACRPQGRHAGIAVAARCLRGAQAPTANYSASTAVAQGADMETGVRNAVDCAAAKQLDEYR